MGFNSAFKGLMSQYLALRAVVFTVTYNHKNILASRVPGRLC